MRVWYTGVMVNQTSEPDPLDINELIRQAEASKKNFRLPRCHNESSRPEVKDWQELMNERLVKPGGW
jgi:hypothetical protein